jgi:hypothetical protein
MKGNPLKKEEDTKEKEIETAPKKEEEVGQRMGCFIFFA